MTGLFSKHKCHPGAPAKDVLVEIIAKGIQL